MDIWIGDESLQTCKYHLATNRHGSLEAILMIYWREKVKTQVKYIQADILSPSI